MAKRFTDTEIWKRQYWFKKLKPEYKLVFIYLKDNCDHAGVWKVDVLSLKEDTGLTDFDLTDFVQKVNVDYDPVTGEEGYKNRLLTLSKGFIWITAFVQFQYENKGKTVSAKVPAIASAISILQGFKILDKALKEGYITLKEPFTRVKDKDKDRDKDSKEVGGVGEETIEPKLKVVDGDFDKPSLEGARVRMQASDSWQLNVLKHLKGYHVNATHTQLSRWINMYCDEQAIIAEDDFRGEKQYMEHFQHWCRKRGPELLKLEASGGDATRVNNRIPMQPRR